MIEYDTIDSGKHAYDYLTSYNRTETTASPCSDISPCAGGSSFPIPADPALVFANASSTQVAGAISIWNGTITGIAYGSSDAAGKRSVIVTFTAANSTVVLAWGGHIASQIDWGAGNSAGAISGSPYHMRLLDLDNDGLGNMDRSLAAAAVAPVPATFTTQVSAASVALGQPVTDLATLAGPNGTVSGTVAFFVCGPNLVSNPDCSTGGTAVGSAVVLSGGAATSPAFTPTLPGKYCFRAQYSPDIFAQYSPGNHTNLTTECFDAVQPLGTLRVIKQVVNDDGGTKTAADFTLHVKSGGSDVAGSPAAGSASGTVYTLPAGGYTVSEDAPPAGYAQTGISGDCAPNGTVTVVGGVQKTCTITNDDVAAKLIVIKNVVNDEAGTKTAADFTLTVTGNTPSPSSFAGAGAPGTQVSIRPGAYSVSEAAVAGYTGSLSSDCAGSIALGETKTCTVTNSDDDTPSSISVTKTATPTSLPEPGGNATFDVKVENTSATDSVTISSLTDDVYGNLDGKGTCDVPQTIAAGASYSCSFSGAVSGNAGSSHKDVVTASGTDDDGNPVTDDDDATVTITDVAGSITVTKTATPTTLPEPGGNATFDVKVENTSSVDSVTISSLTDDVYGNLDGKGTCDVPQTIAAGASYSCSFSGAVSGNAGSSHTDVVTASGTDDDGNPVTDDDDATVTITDVAGSIAVTKTATPQRCRSPVATRPSTSRWRTPRPSTRSRSPASPTTSTATSTARARATCRRRSSRVGATAARSRVRSAATRAAATRTSSPRRHRRRRQPRLGRRRRVVTITNVPARSRSRRRRRRRRCRSRRKRELRREGREHVRDGLGDDLEPDGRRLRQPRRQGHCDVPQTLAPGASYSCSFTGAVSGNAGSSHKDVVTASGTDDDGNAVTDDDDAVVTITNVPSSITVTKTATPTSIQEPGGNVTFAVSVKNTSAVDSVTISSLTDDVYGNLDGKGTCDVPQTLQPGASYDCSFTGAVSGSGGSTHTDVVTASGTDDDNGELSAKDDATVTITSAPPPPPPPPVTPPEAIVAATPVIDLSIRKTDRPDPVFVGSRLTYTLTVRNLGPDTATNVRVADALPAATDFVSVATSQGTCTGGRVVRCSLGTLANGSGAVITIVVRPTEAGRPAQHGHGRRHRGGAEHGEQPGEHADARAGADPAAGRHVPGAHRPAALALRRPAQPGQGGRDRQRNRGVSGVRILVKGPGLYKAATTDGRGRVAISVKPPRTGIVEIRMTNQPARCGMRRIGVVGVIQPPSVTG